MLKLLQANPYKIFLESHIFKLLRKPVKNERVLYSSNLAQSLASDDKRLWISSLEFDETWKNRIAVMASYISVPGLVADFGCGMMWLESFLTEENSYLPIDYVRRDKRTIVIDLNSDHLQEISADVAFLSGILEYIEDLEKFVHDLSDKNFKQVIVSYCAIENFGNIEHRKSFNWVSHASIFELISLFTHCHDLTTIDNVTGNTILVFNRKVS